MQSLSVGGYSKEEIATALHANGRQISFRYEHLDSANDHLGWLDSVRKASVDNNTLANINRTARFSIDDDNPINFLKDRIRPWFRLMMDDWVEWPLGIFLPSTPKRELDAFSAVRHIEAYDQNLVLRDDAIAERYTVIEGTNVIEAVGTVLAEAGITLRNLVATDETMPVDRDWAPGTSRAEIISDLLNSINYRSLYFNAAGYAVAEPYRRPDERPIEYRYTTNKDSVIHPQASREFDLFNVPNRWIATVSEPDRPPLSSVYTNENPSSPTSTISRDRVIADVLEQEEATSQASLDAKVERAAFAASQVYEAVEFTTGIMPHHEDADLIELEYPRLMSRARFVEHTWSMDLAVGSRMKHRIRRVISI